MRRALVGVRGWKSLGCLMFGWVSWGLSCFGVVAARLPPCFCCERFVCRGLVNCCVVGGLWWVWVKLVVGERLLVVAIVMSRFFGGVVFGGV